MNKLLILYKTEKINNNNNNDNDFGNIYELINKYANKYDNVDSYFIVSDNNIKDNYKIINKIIYIKTINNNWESILIKVINVFQIFMNSNYTHIMVTNISTFINIPLMFNNLENIDCLANTGEYNFNNISYTFPSGAGYIFSINFVKKICNFFNENSFINNNILSNNFKNNYPTTDDIFFGYYLKLNNIVIKKLPRYDILDINNYNIDNNLNYTHFRIKTFTDSDYNIHLKLYNKIYK
jgi:hypothetical protein